MQIVNGALNRLLLVLVATAAALASPLDHLKSSYAVKEVHHVPPKWSRVSSAPADHVLNVQIALKQSQFDELERHLYEGNENPFTYRNRARLRTKH